MKRKIVITSVPQMKDGGWADQIGSQYHKGLYTPWPIPTQQQSDMTDPNYRVKNTLQPVPRDESNIEAEKGEVVMGDFDTDGAPESMDVGGKRHSEGGTPLAVPDGSFVFSDTQKLKIKDENILKMFGAGKKGKTPAQLAKNYKLNDYKAMSENPDTDPLTRKTAEMMYGNNLKKLQQLSQVQEMIKESKGIPAQPGQQRMQIGGKTGRAPNWHTMLEDPTISTTPISQTSPVPGRKKKVMITNTPDTNPFRFDLDPNQTQIPTIPGVTPTPANMQQGVYDNNIGTLPIIGRGMDTGTPTAMVSEMRNDVPRYTPSIPRGGNRMNKALAGVKDATGRYRGLSADAITDISLGLKALNTRKYTPWEAPVQAVIPQFIPESDQPIRNALSEVTNTISQNMLQGDPKAGRASALGAQGQLLGQATQAVGQVSNRNAQAMNRYSEQVAGITNERLSQERERAKRLYDGNIISAQQYQNSLNNLAAEMATQAQAKEQKASERAWINKTSPYFAVDNRGLPVFKSTEAQAKYQNEVLNMRQGEGTNSGYSYKDYYDAYKNMGMDDDDAKAAAVKKITDMDKRPKVTTTTKQGNSTKKVQQRYGGLLAFSR